MRRQKSMMIKVSDLFDIKNGDNLSLNKLKLDQNGINFVSRTAKNNGVSAKVATVSEFAPWPAGLITVALGGSVLETFIQPEPFYTGFHIAVLQSKIELSDAQKLYYCACIRSNQYRYSYGRQANRTLKDILIPLVKNIPSWVDDIDVSLFNEVKNPRVAKVTPEINMIFWKRFQLQDLFDIERGRGPRRKDLNGSGSTPFISSSDSNNGLTGFTTIQSIHKGNTIGVNRNGSVGEAFYQPEPFCSTEDVHIFNPKPFWQSRMNAEVGLFIATLIRQEKYRFNYGRKWGIERMKISTIPLPVKADGIPDFDFMENYIRTLPYSSQL